MRKWIWGIVIVIIIISAILIGISLFQNSKNNEQKANNKEIASHENKEKDLVQTNTIINEISVSTQEKEKISPKATLILKKHYEECDHTIKEYAKIPEEYVNLTKEELEDKQEQWEVEEFSRNEVVLIKQLNGVCNQHYVLRQKDRINCYLSNSR